jgi:hypothetical protein
LVKNIADVIINEIVSYLSTNERLIIWERICRNYYRSSLNGNGWMHNLQLMFRYVESNGFLTPFTQLKHSPQQQQQQRAAEGGISSHHNDDNSSNNNNNNNNNNNSSLGRLRNYHRIRYLTTNYSLHSNKDGNDLKWLSLTHLHIIIPADPMDLGEMINTLCHMPILTSLTLEVDNEEDTSIAIPSNSTLTSITILAPFGKPPLFICGVLPNLRVLTIGSGIKVRYCIDNAVPCLETLTFGRATAGDLWCSIIKQCGSSLRVLADHLLGHDDLVYLADHAPHLTSLSVHPLHNRYDQAHQCLEPIAKLINLKHLSINLGYDRVRYWASLVNLQSLSVLNFNTANDSLLSLVRHLSAMECGGNGQLITMNDMNVKEYLKENDAATND